MITNADYDEDGKEIPNKFPENKIKELLERKLFTNYTELT